MKILITGATGYIGHKLALEAAKRNFKVHILVRDLHSKFLPVHPNIVPFPGDITEKKSVAEAMKECSYVMHSAAITKFRETDNSIFYTVNVEGTRNMLDIALKMKVKKFVFTSTGAVIGPSDKLPLSEDDPRLTAFENDYEISKHWAEGLVKDYSRRGLFTVIAVAPRVYGPGIAASGNVFERLLRKIYSLGIAFVPPCKDVQANYAYVDDVVNGHFLVMEKGLAGEKYILGGENISYREFFHTIRALAGKKIRLVTVPKSILLIWSFFHMLIYRITGRQTNISPKIIFRLYQNRALSCEKAKRHLGYYITPFESGIRQTIYKLKNKHND